MPNDWLMRTLRVRICMLLPGESKRSSKEYRAFFHTRIRDEGARAVMNFRSAFVILKVKCAQDPRLRRIESKSARINIRQDIRVCVL